MMIREEIKGWYEHLILFFSNHKEERDEIRNNQV